MKKTKMEQMFLFVLCMLPVGLAAGCTQVPQEAEKETVPVIMESQSRAESFVAKESFHETELEVMRLQRLTEEMDSKEGYIAISKDADASDPLENGISREQMAREFLQYLENKGLDFDNLIKNDSDTLFDELEQFGKETGYDMK